jgi:hypothetical protein
LEVVVEQSVNGGRQFCLAVSARQPCGVIEQFGGGDRGGGDLSHRQ